MILEFPREDASLGSFLHARAFVSSTRRLLLDVAVGLTVAGAMFGWRPRGWIVFASAGLCLGMYGVWALAERRLEMDGPQLSRVAEVSLRALRGVAAATGLVGALSFAFALGAVTLGTWIS